MTAKIVTAWVKSSEKGVIYVFSEKELDIAKGFWATELRGYRYLRETSLLMVMQHLMRELKFDREEATILAEATDPRF